MDEPKLLFCNVDDEGNITHPLAFGEKISPTQDYDYYFYLEEFPDVEPLDIPNQYKIELEGYKPKLVKR